MQGAQSIAASHQEVIDLFRAWQIDGALIRIDFRLRVLTATVLACVRSASDDQLTFSTQREWAELTLPLPRGAIFRYFDLWAVPEGRRFERIIVLFYPDATPCTADPATLDQVVFAEIRERRAGGDAT
jgi:hypothetical protein